MDLEFTVNQPLPGQESYHILDKENGRRTSDKARPLGRGNVGLVYRAEFKGLHRAIKFLSPKLDGDQQAQLPLDLLENSFENEIRVLSTITHTSICKIVDFGRVQIGSGDYPYYAMDYVEGQTFDKFCENKATGVRDVLLVLDQVLDGLGHLHSAGYYHMDVKEENILVQSPIGSRPRAVLLDLGGAKQVRAPASIHLRENTVYVSTDKATREGRRSQLGKPTPRTRLADWGPDLDFYALGVMIQRALATDKTLRAKVQSELTISGLAALEWVVEHLIQGPSDLPGTQRHYQSAAQIRADLERLLPQYTWPLGLPELSFVVSATSIQLPQERIGLTPNLLNTINHPIFQRLKYIPQLEYIHLIYPGARHSRFEHAIYTFHLARLFLIRLLEYPDFRMLATPDHVQATLLAALLHDIGHYPLSHMFEDFAAGRERTSHSGVQFTPTDDDLFYSFVSPVTGERFAEIVKRASARAFPGKQSFDSRLRELFPRAYELLLEVANAKKAGPPPIPLLHSLIDSAIDVDKIAYVTHDSLATGVPFGQGIDLFGLVQALVPPRGDDQLRGAIAITEDGLAAAESIILNRFWMVDRVYWHRTNRSVMAMHKFVISDLIEAKKLDFDRYFEETLFASQDDATRLLAREFDDCHSARVSNQDRVRNPLNGILEADRGIYKRLLTVSNGPSERDHELYRFILETGADGLLTLAEQIRQEITRLCPELRLIYGDVLVDIPHKRRDVLGSNVLVYLDREPYQARNLHGGQNPVSPLLRGVPENFEHNVKKFRVFVHPEVMERIDSLGQVDKLRDGIRSYLQEYFEIPPHLPW